MSASVRNNKKEHIHEILFLDAGLCRLTLSWMSWMLIRLLFCSKQNALASVHDFVSIEKK